MWFREEPLVVKRKRTNRKRRPKTSILSVNARVTEQRHDRLQKTAAVVLSLTALAGVLWGAVLGIQALERVLFTANQVYTIRQLDLHSDGSLLKERHIREYAKLAEGQNLFGVSLDRIRKDLLSVPVVASVEVSRELPDTLGVRLTERLALARLGVDNRRNHLAIDREGHVLGPSSRRPGLPSITGLRDQGLRPGNVRDDKLLMDGLTVLDLCDSSRLGEVIHVKNVDVRNPEYLDLTLEGGERVLLGRTQPEWRLQRLVQSLRTASQLGKKIKVINLTVDKNPPVEWM